MADDRQEREERSSSPAPPRFTWWHELALIGSALGAVALLAGAARLLMPPVQYAAKYKETEKKALRRIRSIWRAGGSTPSEAEAEGVFNAVLRTIEQYLDVALMWHVDVDKQGSSKGWMLLEQMYVAVFCPRAVPSKRVKGTLVFGPRELSMLFSEAGVHKTELVHHLFTQIDSNHNKEIDFVEFLRALSIAKRGTPPAAKLEFVFKCIDVDKNGAVSEREVSAFLTNYCSCEALGNGGLTADSIVSNWWRAMSKSSSTAHPIRKAQFEGHLHWPGKDLELEVIENIGDLVAQCIPLKFCIELCKKQCPDDL